VISWDAVPFNGPGKWRERLECLVGRMERLDGERFDATWIADAYREWSAESILGCARRYGAGYIVIPANYPWVVRFQSGAWRVQQLP